MFSLHRVQAGATPFAAPIEFDFERGLRETYRHFGVADAVFRLSARERPAVTHISVRNREGVVVGGARIHRASPGRPLPALRALETAPALRAALMGEDEEALVELASLWVKRDRSLRGLGRLIGQASIAAAAADGVRRAVTFSHLTIAGMLHAIGMRATPDADPIGYPNPTYQSTVWEVDPRNPEHADPTDREQIASIRQWWTDDPSAAIGIESTTRTWSVVGPFQPATQPERVHNNVQANRPVLVPVPQSPDAGAEPNVEAEPGFRRAG